MPEIPDLTVYLDALERRLLGRTLTGIRLGSPFLLSAQPQRRSINMNLPNHGATGQLREGMIDPPLRQRQAEKTGDSPAEFRAGRRLKAQKMLRRAVGLIGFAHQHQVFPADFLPPNFPGANIVTAQPSLRQPGGGDLAQVGFLETGDNPGRGDIPHHPG